MKKLAVFILFLILFENSTSQEQKKIVDSVVSEATSEFPEVGLVIGVYNKSGTHYYSYGNRTKEGHEKLDSLSLFEIGSATKTFTALLLAHEVQNQHIGQHDFIDHYLPQENKLPSTLKERIRVTDLASHQSGLPNLSNDKYFSNLLRKDPRNPFRFVDKEYLYKVLDSTDSLQAYGKYQYNNYAYSLLGALLEETGKKSYSKLVHEVILDPLEMNSTSFEIPQGGNVAGLYNQDGVAQVHMIIDAANPAGGLKSNAVDLIKYLRAHLQNKNLADAVEITQETFYEDQEREIGLAWEIEDDYFQKDGDTFGNSSLIRYSPENHTAIVILSNHQNGKLVRDLMNGIYDKVALKGMK